ncbi:hypothetical protein AURDEDRAFT_174393 [Auricularia subglabra TFB-10046 SS5]|uniref:LysM domain-containing protein n=1 Tax=Auricularia subglabra (strain TFB-10046 / SS5) TaxID=717982 RepID=J0LGC1_AURST|nr:hypothetical protein AURDEDRAFT_174393 [Auricularia subglabra TFB-10046 SS5]
MTKFSTLLFFLAAATTAFSSPVPDVSGGDMSLSVMPMDTAVVDEANLDDVDALDSDDFETADVDEEDYEDYEEDEDFDLEFEDAEDDVDLEFEDDEEVDEEASLTRREVCNVGQPNTKVVDKVYAVARKRKVNAKVMLATFETAAIESNFNNLNCGDQDSVGVFQQRPSQGWGTVKQLMNVAYATNKFLDRAIPNDRANRGYTPGQLAQSVQISEFPDRYDTRKAQAQKLIAQAKARYSKKSKGKGKPKKNSKPKKSSGKAPKNLASGSAKGCKKYHTVKKGDTCAPLAKAGGVSLSKFLSLNKGLNSKCTNLQLGKAYCLKK